MNEIWKEYKLDFKSTGLLVSNCGNVKNLYNCSRAICDNGFGYKNTFVHNLDTKKQKQFYIHRLVATLFLDTPSSDKIQVNHIDGDKSNNKASNLEWCTAKENSQHSVKNKLYGRNTDSSRRVRRETTTEKVHAICKLIQQGLTNYKIADELDVCRKVVERIKNRKRYTEISKDYTW